MNLLVICVVLRCALVIHITYFAIFYYNLSNTDPMSDTGSGFGAVLLFLILCGLLILVAISETALFFVRKRERRRQKLGSIKRPRLIPFS